MVNPPVPESPTTGNQIPIPETMVDLHPAPFVELIDRCRLEYAHQRAIFDLPAAKWYLPTQESDAPDLSVSFHGRRAGTPVGPASGPHTQMAQNLVLSWLAGARILELKTVQIDDRLSIARPCIDAANVGYNIEFSQELRVHQSLDQYVQGAMLIHMLRFAPHLFGHPFGKVDWTGAAGATLFDMSVGYDLAGIRSDKVQGFIHGMIDATASVDRLRGQIPHRLKELRELDYPARLSRCITLSTFHGCPADEIEKICQFLLVEMETDVIIKMNPPMLGKEQLEHLLHEVMGYREIRVNPSAYTSGLVFDEAVRMCGRLSQLASSRGRRLGAKFSNTLEVMNTRNFFPPGEEVMYMSGPPLHVITLSLADRFRKEVGPDFPISFSAGVDQKNFAQMVACGFTPVTTCTDLLKTGGYGRLPRYLHALEKAMRAAGASNVDQFRLAARGQHEASGGDPARAGWLNTAIITEEACRDRRYHQDQNCLAPRRIDSRLLLFDCITCVKCVPICPNDANFLYAGPPVDLHYHDLEIAPDGTLAQCGEPVHFVVERMEQIANYADFCNHCGNCDTFCPEWDGPYLKKPNFFGSRQAFQQAAPLDGFLLEGKPGNLSLVGRIGGATCRLETRSDRLQKSAPHGPDELSERGPFRYNDGTVTITVADGKATGLASSPPPAPHRVDMGRFHALTTLLIGITNGSRVTQVNTRLLSSRTN